MIRDLWMSFWYRLIYKTIRIDGYRKVINRFTGEFRVYKIRPLARVGVNFSRENVDKINRLLGGERKADAQRLILTELEREFALDGLPEALIMAAFHSQNGNGMATKE